MTAKKKKQYPTAGSLRYRIQDLPAELRPRELADVLGVENLQDDVLLALILRVGTKGRNAVELARELLLKHQDLAGLARASVEDLAQAAPGMGKVKAQILKAALELASRLNRGSAKALPAIRKPEDAAAVLRELARPLDKEVFWVLVLNVKNRLKTQPVKITEGLLDSTQVHPREVFQPAIRNGAAAVILAHNHPSGDTAPSAEDIKTTKQMIQSGKELDIRVLDHIIIGRPSEAGGKDFISMRESGMVSFA